ncbi:hypothetical protein CIB84_000522 [Bambusicola thoracicus]|uniref:Cilia- and flagella-associated protein 74 n=1 Tax=Bambusicola thoracicus TaxID=9083 RepID=A0A2P4TH87_BAMTH|nr:hypothetical protein CIB84_000522 [Bambusicola thoracicus]
MEGSSEPGSGGEEEPTLIPFLEEEGNSTAAQSSDLGEHGEEYKLEEDLSDDGTMGNEVTSEGAGDKSEPSMDSLEHGSDNVTSSQALKSADRICLFPLPRNLKELSDIAKEKKRVVQKIRDELTACQLRIKALEKQLENVDIETEEEKEAGNVAAVFRLQATHRRLCTELEDEKNFELKIALTLQENMLEMWRIETQQGKYEILHKQPKKDEEELEMQYQEQAEVRIRKEKIAALKADENQLSLKKIHEEKAKEEAKTQEHMERRIQAVLSLKNSITSNREKLQALQAWNQAVAKKQEMTMREAILAEGGNVAKEIFLHKRLLQHEKEKQAFIEQQKLRKIEIVSKILEEKASICKQKNQQSCTKAIKSGGKCKDSLLWRKKTWRYIEKTCKHPAGALPQKSWCSPSVCSPAGERTASVGECSEEVPHDVPCGSEEGEKERDEITAEPELPGLLSQECDLHKLLPVIDTYWYVWHLKDFDVGKIYKKKIVLINASYSINYCKPVGISEWLKDFISIQVGMALIGSFDAASLHRFDPPGKMSAGMSCEVGVTFKPVVTQLCSDSAPEKKDSNGSVTSVLEKKEQISLDGSEDPTCCVAQAEQQRTETSSTDAFNFSSDKDMDDAHNFMACSPEETPIEIMLGKVTEGEIGPFSSVKLQIIFMPSIPGAVRAEFEIVFDNSDCKPLYFSATGVAIDVPVWVPNPNVDLKICMYDRLYQDCIVILSRHSLPGDAGSCFNEETGVLEAPVTIQIADNFVEIQPNDGLGVLLPLESLTLHVIFKPNKAKEYSFELSCKSEVNRYVKKRLEHYVVQKSKSHLISTVHVSLSSNKIPATMKRQFKLSCRAVGVHPPLELSHSLVQFAATALNDVSTATLYVMNSHVSANFLTHAVPRIGNGEVAPVGPTSFEFYVPEDCPVTITPSVGTVLPGEKSLIQVSFRPTLSDQLIREEAAQRLCGAAATGAEIQETKKEEKTEGKKLSVPISRRQSSRQVVRTGSVKCLSSSHKSEQPESKEIKPDSEAYIAAQAFLTRNFRGRFEKYTIPCFVASGHIDEKRGSESLSFSPCNTLYLELHCPAVAPSVVVTSDNGKNTVDFGAVAVANGLKQASPWQFLEMLDIQTAKNNLALRITGYGVMPSTVCSVEVLDMGYVLTREKATSTFKKTAHVIQLKGAARDHPMFVEGGIPLDVPIESLAVTLPQSPKKALKEELQEPVKSILLLLEHVEGENAPLPAVAELKVGAIQTAQFASKKNVEFSFDNLSHLQKKGFAIEPVKGKVDRGHVKCISVRWVPPADFHAPLCSSGDSTKDSDQCPQNMSNWTSLWYVWLLLLTVFMLLLCGITASCKKFCCRKKRPPVQPFPRHPYDLTVVAIDSDSTAHSTVTSYSSFQYPPSAPIPSIFVGMDRSTVSPPAYSPYAMDLPPSYDEAVQMGKQHIEVALVNQKLSDIPGQVMPGGQNPIQNSPDIINRDPATQPNSEDATQEQPQL